MMFIRLKKNMKGAILNTFVYFTNGSDSSFYSLTSRPVTSTPGNLLEASLKTTDLREQKNCYYLINSPVVFIWYLTIENKFKIV